MSADVADDVTFALSNVVENGTGRSVQTLSRPVAGKTGTNGVTVGDKDIVNSSWFVGYTKQISTAVMFVAGDAGTASLDDFRRPGTAPSSAAPIRRRPGPTTWRRPPRVRRSRSSTRPRTSIASRRRRPRRPASPPRPPNARSRPRRRRATESRSDDAVGSTSRAGRVERKPSASESKGGRSRARSRPGTDGSRPGAGGRTGPATKEGDPALSPAGRREQPSSNDAFVRTLSRRLGGPIGRHAVTGTGWWSPARVALLVGTLVYLAGVVFRLPCRRVAADPTFQVPVLLRHRLALSRPRLAPGKHPLSRFRRLSGAGVSGAHRLVPGTRTADHRTPRRSAGDGPDRGPDPTPRP